MVLIIFIGQYKEEQLIQKFGSCREASRAMTGKSDGSSHISDCCKGKRKTAYRYSWKYID